MNENFKCPQCEKGHMVKRNGQHGEFMACNQYPDCKHTISVKPETKLVPQNNTGEYAEIPVTPKPVAKKEKFEAHLSIEQVRTNAMDFAMRRGERDDFTILKQNAQTFEKYLLTGE